MYQNDLSDFAGEYGLHFRDGIAYGRCKGCFISVCLEEHNYWRFRIYIGTEHSIGADALYENAWNAAAYIRWNTTDFIYGVSDANPRNENSALHILENGRIVEISLCDCSSSGRYCTSSLPQLRAFAENILPHLAEHTAPNVCAHCGKPVRFDAKPFYMTGQDEPDMFQPAFLPCGAVVPMHAACAEAVRETSEQVLRARREMQKKAQRIDLILAIGSILFWILSIWLKGR